MSTMMVPPQELFLEFDSENGSHLSSMVQAPVRIQHTFPNRANKRRLHPARWTKSEDAQVREAVKQAEETSLNINWKALATSMAGRRSEDELKIRWEKTLKDGQLVKGLWTEIEDQTIQDCIENGITTWTQVAESVGSRTEKQCRERYSNHLDPSIVKGNWTESEDEALCAAQLRFGNKWKSIAKAMEGRCENAVKNRWNSASFREKRARNLAAGVLLHGAITSSSTTLSVESVESDTTSPKWPQDSRFLEGNLVWVKEGSEDRCSWWPSLVFSSWTEVMKFGLPTPSATLTKPPKGGCIAFLLGPDVLFSVIDDASSKVRMMGDPFVATDKKRMGKEKARAWELAVSESRMFMELFAHPPSCSGPTPNLLPLDSSHERPRKREKCC